MSVTVPLAAILTNPTDGAVSDCRYINNAKLPCMANTQPKNIIYLTCVLPSPSISVENRPLI